MSSFAQLAQLGEALTATMKKLEHRAHISATMTQTIVQLKHRITNGSDGGYFGFDRRDRR